MLSVIQLACDACGAAAGALAAMPAVESNRRAAATAAVAILDPKTRMRILPALLSLLRDVY
jgi:hypothetical protein